MDPTRPPRRNQECPRTRSAARLRLAFGPILVLVAGCTGPAGPVPAPAPFVIGTGATAAAPIKGRSAAIKLRLSDAGGRRLMAEVATLTIADIEHVSIDLTDFTHGNVSLDRASVPGPKGHESLLSRTITFGNLRTDTVYRVYPLAYSAPDEAVPENLISLPDTFGTIAVTNNDVLDLELDLQLADVPFNGRDRTSGIALLPGGYNDPQGPITITIAE